MQRPFKYFKDLLDIYSKLQDSAGKYLKFKSDKSDIEFIDLDTTISNKVDKVLGKGLSTQDFTNQYKELLENILAASSSYVTGQLLTGFISSTGTIQETNTIIDAIGILDENISILQQDTTIRITKTLTLNPSWQDTGIQNTDLESGTYIIQLFANDINQGGYNNNEYYSGIISWYSGSTNTSLVKPTDEIILHRAGGSTDAGLFLRTFRSSSETGENLKLQVFSNEANPSASNYVFSFKKII